MSETSTDHLVSVLHASQDRLAAALDGVSAEQAATQSYDDDWTVAQVASHLGSGAELFTLFLEAGLVGEPAPGVEAMQPVWDEWNGKDALSQVRDAVAVNEAFLERIDALTEAQREAWGPRPVRLPAHLRGVPADAPLRACRPHLGHRGL